MILAVKEIGAFLFLISGNWQSEYFSIWQIAGATLIIISLFLNIYYKNIASRDLLANANKQNHISELFSLLLIISGFLTLYVLINYTNFNIFLKFNRFYDFKPENTLTFLTGDLLAFYITFLAFYILNFLSKWYMFFRNKSTKIYLIFTLYLIIYIILSDYLINLVSDSFALIFRISNFLLLILLGIIIWSLFSKHRWISAIERNLKIKYLIYSLLGIIISSIIIILLTNESSLLVHSIENFSSAIIQFGIISFFFINIYFIRIFIISISSVSYDNKVNKKTNELNSVAFLTKFINESVDKDRSEIINLMTDLAFNTTDSVIAWTEIYDDKLMPDIIATKTINEDIIRELHNNKICHSLLTRLNKPYLVQSIDEHKEFFLFKNYIATANSLMAVPVYSGMHRIGTLVVINEEEFGLDQDDIDVLSVFSDNLRLALENNRLMKDSLEKQKYQNELQLAHNIQKELLPHKLPYPKNYNIDAFSYPATEVGGDYYDVIRLANGNYCFLIADVSGKGLSASFYMAQLKGIVLSIDGLKQSPAEVLKMINKTLYRQMDKKMYITMSCLSADNSTGKITLARAGHMPFLIKQGGEINDYIPKGIGIGLVAPDFFDKNIDELTINLSSGDICLMITDGINELRNKERREYGYEYLKELLKDSDCNSKELINNLSESLFDFSRETEQHDDMTAIAICFNGK